MHLNAHYVLSHRPSEARWQVKLPDDKLSIARRLSIHRNDQEYIVSAQRNSEDVIIEAPFAGMDADLFPATLVRASGERAGA